MPTPLHTGALWIGAQGAGAIMVRTDLAVPEETVSATFEHARAAPMALLGGPMSSSAKALIEHLLDDVVVPAMTQRRPSSIAKARLAVGALLADLFDLHRGYRDDKRPLPGAHGMSPKDFPVKELGFGHVIFVQAVQALEDGGLLARTVGRPRWRKAFSAVFNLNGQVTTFELSPPMIDLAVSYGVQISGWGDHWRAAAEKVMKAPMDQPRLVRRTRKVRNAGKKAPAEDMPIDMSDPIASALEREVDMLNAFLSLHAVEGIALPGLRRIFSEGDDPAFAWNKGGRYYSLRGGHHYETMSADRRLERIRIDGEPVGEADIRASHLTFLHALLDRPFDPSASDPYAVGGIDRTIIKWWMAQAIGSASSVPRQWASGKKDEYAAAHPGRELQADFPMSKVGVAVRERHPVLAELGKCGIDTFDLQFHESEVLRQAMGLLVREDVPALPIHDGLIVQVSKVPMAQVALVQAFRDHVGSVIGHPPLVVPKVTPKLPGE